MKKFVIIYILLVFIGLAVSACSANIFSYLNPTDPGVVNDVNILVAMGDNYVNKMDYTNAYAAYSRAVALDPRNSRAMEGSALAYIYMHYTFNQIFTCIMNHDFTSLGANGFYKVSREVTRNLINIVNGNSDGVIPSTDVNDNLNFFIFCGYYSVFYLIDTDNDGDIDSDTNDYIIMDSNYVTSNRVFDVIATNLTNRNMVPIIGMAYTFNHIKKTGYTNLRYWSDRSLGILSSSLYNASTLAIINQMSNIFVNYDTNFGTFFSFFETNKLIDMIGGGDPTNLTLFFTNDYDVFINQVYLEGIWPPSAITNAMPDMTNVYPILQTNYGHLFSLDY